MKYILFVLLLYSNYNYAQKVIKLAHESIDFYSNDSIISRSGDEYNGSIVIKKSFGREEYQILNGYIQSINAFNNDNIQTSTINYQQGKYHGSYKIWNNQGVLLIDGFYKNNIKDSLWGYTITIMVKNNWKGIIWQAAQI